MCVHAKLAITVPDSALLVVWPPHVGVHLSPKEAKMLLFQSVLILEGGSVGGQRVCTYLARG